MTTDKQDDLQDYKLMSGLDRVKYQGLPELFIVNCLYTLYKLV